MNLILNSAGESLDLLPGAVLTVMALDPGSYGAIYPVAMGNVAGFASVNTIETGYAHAGPFTEVVRLRVEAIRRVGVDISSPLGTGIPVPSAGLGSLVGQPGAVYLVADGDKAGAKIVWGTPAGASEPTWCWWLWPQAAFEL